MIPQVKSRDSFIKLDEELEDYDYLDNMTGRDDKPWIYLKNKTIYMTDDWLSDSFLGGQMSW